MKLSAFIALLAAPFNTLAQAKTIVEQAVAQAKAIGEMFAQASLDADEILAGGADALKTKIDSLIASAVTTAVSAKEVELKAIHALALDALRSEQATATAAALTAKDGEMIAAFASIGVTLTKFDKATATAGLKARAEAISHELLAARGAKPLPEKVTKTDESIEANLTTDAGILAAYEAMPVGEARVAFLEKHKAAIWRAFNA